MNAKQRFKLFRTIASCANQAANRSGADREFETLTAVIRKQEKEHRQFGRGLVGRSATKGRFTLAQATDLFVVRTLAWGYENHTKSISVLVGTREDFVRAAILVARPEFREAFERELVAAEKRGDLPSMASPRAFLQYADGLADYSALANGEI